LIGTGLTGNPARL